MCDNHYKWLMNLYKNHHGHSENRDCDLTMTLKTLLCTASSSNALAHDLCFLLYLVCVREGDLALKSIYLSGYYNNPLFPGQKHNFKVS